MTMAIHSLRPLLIRLEQSMRIDLNVSTLGFASMRVKEEI